MAEVHHQCATGFVQKHLPFDPLDSARSHRFFSSQFWQEKIWEKFPADEYLLGGEILKSNEDGLVATGVPNFVITRGALDELKQEVSDLRSDISGLKEVIRTDK